MSFKIKSRIFHGDSRPHYESPIADLVATLVEELESEFTPYGYTMKLTAITHSFYRNVREQSIEVCVCIFYEL